MKIFLMATSFVLLSVISNAQHTNNTGMNVLPVPAKGYYSIYQNAQKLTPQREYKAGVADTELNNVQKGYYAIASNNQKLKPKYKVYSNDRPAVTKGYYSIGNNNKKLQ